MFTRHSALALICAPLFVLASTRSALANPRPLPFTYPHEQLVEGGTELEQFVDFTTAKAANSNTGNPAQYGLFQFQTEFEHGITDRLELGLYVMYAPSPSSEFTQAPNGVEGNGMKQRLRYKLADTGVWPIDVALYGELVENQSEFEIEAKIILQRRIGIARIMANVTAEQELYYNDKHDFVLDPSAGVTFEATPAVQPGIEWWMRKEFHEDGGEAGEGFGEGPHQYIGPALLLQMGPLWWTNGFYVRVSDWNHAMVPGDAFGRLWIRSVIGYGF